MRFFCYMFFLLVAINFCLLPFALAGNNKKNIVLIYQGPGSCEDGCSNASARIPASLGYPIRYVNPNELNSNTFENAILWIQPGGNAIEAAEALGKEKLQLIRNFVWEGGAYVGFCAGAFLADTIVDDNGLVEGLGIIPVTSFYAPIDSNDGNGTMTWINWNGRIRHLYFNGGAGFNVEKKDTTVNVLARFANDQIAATIQTRFGRGNVVVTGAHPEATTDWISESKLTDIDGSDNDLAQNMVLLAISKKKGVTKKR